MITDPTVQMAYDLHNWQNNNNPVYVHTSARETHKDAQSNWLQSYTYSDGLGRELQTKVQAEDGPAWQLNGSGNPEEVNSTNRWTATGRTIYNNKGKVVKQYEPWFSTTHEYEGEDELTQYGVSPFMHYDPVGRLIQTDLPDGTFSKVVFDAWKLENHDRNDTVLDSTWYSDRNSPDPAGSEPTNKEERAAWLAAKHANTPQVQHFDGLGRLFLTQDDNANSNIYETRQKYDIAGNVLAVKDAKNRWMTENIYNMPGQVVYTFNIDSDRRWLLNDVAGKPIRLPIAIDRNNRHQQTEFAYDALQRPINTSLRLSALAVHTIAFPSEPLYPQGIQNLVKFESKLS